MSGDAREDVEAAELATVTRLDDAATDADLLQLLADNIHDVVALTQGDATIVWISSSVEALLGYEPAQMVGHPFTEYVVAEDWADLRAQTPSVLAGDVINVEVRLRHRDQSIRWTSIVAHQVELSGRGRVRVSTWRDITASRQARESLAQSRHDYQRVAEYSSDVVLQTDVNGVIDWVSPSVTTILGWRALDVVGQRVLELVADSDVERAAAWQSLVLLGGQVRAAQIRFHTAAGETRWMAVRAQTSLHDRLITGVVMSLRDCHVEVITRRALNTLSAVSRVLTRSESEQDLLNSMCQAAVNEGGYVLCWYARPAGPAATYFARAASSYEYREFAEASRLSLGDQPGTRSPAGVAWCSGQTVVVNNRLTDTRFTCTEEAQRVRHFHATIALPVYCAHEIDGVLIVEAPEVGAFDVAVVSMLEELAAQMGFGIQRLRDRASLLQSLSEQLLLSAAVSQSGESIAITDVEGTLIYVNPALTRASGYARDELIGQNPRIFQSGLQNRAFYEEMWQQLGSGSSWRGTLVNRRKNGELYEEEATISPIRDETGQLTAYVAVKRDLTLERTLQASLTSDGRDRATILELMREMRPVSSLEAMADLFCRLVTRLDHIDASTLLIRHHDQTLSLMGQHGSALAAMGLSLNVPASAFAAQLREGASAMVLDLNDDRLRQYDSVRTAIDEGGARGAVATPLRWNDDTIGVLFLSTRDARAAQDLTRRLGAFDQLGTYAGSYFGSQIDAQIHREELRAEVQGIIDDRAFTPVFQPFVELATGRVVGYEALTRFANGRRPDLCIRDAHQVGLGPELEAACAMAAIDAARDLDPAQWLSVNFSPAAILGHYVDPVLAASERDVILEITEHDPIENYADIREVVARLPHCQLAVDDAGAGFTSLSHILELRPRYVKLDISIIRDIDTNPARQAMTAGMCHFAAQTDTIVIAEGIETQAEADTLIRLGISLGQHVQMLGQGYFFGRPQPMA